MLFVERDLLLCSVGSEADGSCLSSRRRNTRLLLDGGGVVVRADGEDRTRPVLGDDMKSTKEKKRGGLLVATRGRYGHELP